MYTFIDNLYTFLTRTMDQNNYVYFFITTGRWPVSKVIHVRKVMFVSMLEQKKREYSLVVD